MLRTGNDDDVDDDGAADFDTDDRAEGDIDAFYCLIVDGMLLTFLRHVILDDGAVQDAGGDFGHGDADDEDGYVGADDKSAFVDYFDATYGDAI